MATIILQSRNFGPGNYHCVSFRVAVDGIIYMGNWSPDGLRGLRRQILGHKNKHGEWRGTHYREVRTTTPLAREVARFLRRVTATN